MPKYRHTYELKVFEQPHRSKVGELLTLEEVEANKTPIPLTIPPQLKMIQANSIDEIRRKACVVVHSDLGRMIRSINFGVNEIYAVVYNLSEQMKSGTASENARAMPKV